MTDNTVHTVWVKLESVGGHPIIRLPQVVSDSFPSRGLVMARGCLSDQPFTLPLEPDGKGGHWLGPDDALLKAAGAAPGDSLQLSLSPAENWPEPRMPDDILQVFAPAGILVVWDSLTTKARWEWLRWIRATGNTATRQKRIGAAISKMQSGMRRPCCFNAASCTVPEVSKGGTLKESDAGQA